jgi:hypothetical protein
LGRFGTELHAEIGSLLSDTLNGAQLRDIAENCIREAVLLGKDSIDPQQFLTSIVALTEKREPSEISLLDALKTIRAKNRKRLPQSRLAALLGISQPQMSRRLKDRS